MVLSDFSITLAEHEVTGLIGLNGAGKTTFLNVLSGLHPAYRAAGIHFHGHPAKPRHKNFKLCRYTVFAEDASFQYFTFRDICPTYFLPIKKKQRMYPN